MLTIRNAFRVALFGAFFTLMQLVGAIYLRQGNVERLSELKAELSVAGEGQYSWEQHLREDLLRTRIDMHKSTILWNSLYTSYFLLIALAIHRDSKRKQ